MLAAEANPIWYSSLSTPQNLIGTTLVISLSHTPVSGYCDSQQVGLLPGFSSISGPALAVLLVIPKLPQ